VHSARYGNSSRQELDDEDQDERSWRPGFRWQRLQLAAAKR